MPDDALILKAAEGWLELGNFLEANEELEKLPPEDRAHPEVFKLRCRIYHQAQKWQELQILAESCARQFFVRYEEFWTQWAIAEHRLGNTWKASTILEGIAPPFPQSASIPYHLACFTAALGRDAEAEKWLSVAFVRTPDPKALKLRALDQPELERLWGEGILE